MTGMTARKAVAHPTRMQYQLRCYVSGHSVLLPATGADANTWLFQNQAIYVILVSINNGLYITPSSQHQNLQLPALVEIGLDSDRAGHNDIQDLCFVHSFHTAFRLMMTAP